MGEINLKNKDASIAVIVKKIIDHYGKGFFETYTSNDEEMLVDFWDADLFAVGLKRKKKVVYISTWDFRTRHPEDMKYVVEFELIDENTLESKERIKEMNEINEANLLKQIQWFLDEGRDLSRGR